MTTIAKLTVIVIANVNNVHSTAIAKLGLDFSEISYINTSCVEPVRPAGMGRDEFFALDRIYTVEVGINENAQ